jgi:hypothetical protein
LFPRGDDKVSLPSGKSHVWTTTDYWSLNSLNFLHFSMSFCIWFSSIQNGSKSTRNEVVCSIKDFYYMFLETFIIKYRDLPILLYYVSLILVFCIIQMNLTVIFYLIIITWSINAMKPITETLILCDHQCLSIIGQQ